MNTGETIRYLLKKNKMTQKELALEINISGTAMSQIVKGYAFPHSKTLSNILEVFKIPESVFYLLSITEDDVPENKKDLFRVFHPFVKEFYTDLYN